MNEHFIVGTAVIITVTFTDSESPPQPYAPGTVVLKVQSPVTKTVSQPSLSNPSTGVYQAIVLANEVGTWQAYWSGVGGLVSAYADVIPLAFVADPTPF